MKKFFAGILAGVLLMTGTYAFAETKLTIEAIFGQVKLVVDGKSVDKETLLYNGTTYVPLRAAAETLGMEVGWNATTNTASLTSKATATPTPAPTPEPTEPEDDSVKVVQKDPPFTISKIEYTLEILPPNSIGTRYMRTWYANRTKYTITSFSLKWFDKGTRQDRYISNYQHIKTGELSDQFEGFGPKSGMAEDIELLETSVSFLNKNGDEVRLKYNHKTKEYSVSGDW